MASKATDTVVPGARVRRMRSNCFWATKFPLCRVLPNCSLPEWVMLGYVNFTSQVPAPKEDKHKRGGAEAA